MSSDRMISFVLCLIAVLALMLAGSVSAGVPKKINYQGRITDSDTGEPLRGSHNMAFRIYDVESGGMALWSETLVVDADTTGVVSVILGDETRIDISFDGERWLEVEVEGEVLEPRRELVSVPYAFTADDAGHAQYADSAQSATSAGHAENADSLGGMPAGSYVTDRHSLDADDGYPEDAVYVDGMGFVGVGTTDPLAPIHVRRDVDEWAEILVENPNAGSNSKEALTFSSEGGVAGLLTYDGSDPFKPNALTIYNDRSAASIRLNTQGHDHVVLTSAGRLGVGTDEPGGLLDVDGDARINSLYLGDPTQDGLLEAYMAGTSKYIVWLGDYLNNGGRLVLGDENGEPHTVLQADASPGGGGYLNVRSGPGVNDVTIDGNYADTGEPMVRILGTTRLAVFDMSKTEDESVRLPQSSISASEVIDEAGLAANISYEVPGGLPLSNGFNIIGQQSITVPASGYVLVIGSVQPTCNLYTTSDMQCEFGVSDSSGSFPDNQDCLWMLPSQIGGSPTSRVFTTVLTNHRVFEVASVGTYTYYYLARLHKGTVTANDVQLTVIYFPSSYGDVETLVSGSGPHTFSIEDETVAPSGVESFASERERSEKAYRERIEQELAAMRAQIEALREELKADPNRQEETE